ncbi:uncharacterized protein [Physcomitrium patens]|uniref:RING-type E3 ubiquitin transferase n=1 Tax=Physcomitrium patens TaxID=3218 RepID=A0A2K1JPX2_PHYPA|nr:E3 ubiquitin-protein ligase SIRP1-like [Physcomitrium patens]PNR43561.1 hypothetical protein PHYPA_015942 [Physcomitrium patens]|eukprot:XP_024390293.1 E3 ubiquitin-protein ligase SIRP1-like [Physcomitrella patens]
MSSSVVATSASGAAGGHKSRSAGKGRRRRAAAEQRRIEQQRWGGYAQDDEEDFSVVAAPSPPTSRRRSRRRDSVEDRREDSFDLTRSDHLAAFDDIGADLELALALSVSFAETNPGFVHRTDRSFAPLIVDMTYESLVQLEDVRCVASAATVAALPVCLPEKVPEAVSEACVICQEEFEDADSQVQLPCSHVFHQPCGAHWLLIHSKLCPICKHDVTESAAAETTSPSSQSR